jgi:thymidylate synthase
MIFSLRDGSIPIITTKKTAWKTCLKELLWFIHGETDAEILQSKGVHIWDANTNRDFLDSRGLKDTRTGLIGPGYGFQWRHFNAKYDQKTGCPIDQGIDQLKGIIDDLKNAQNRNSRRLIMTAWNPCQLDEMALPPCHVMCQFRVHHDNRLSCAMYQRSVDVALGMPFNIASYSFLTHLLAKHCGLIADELIYFMGDCHIYKQHIESMKLVLKRDPFPFPTLRICEKRENIEDYKVEDFVISNYQSHELIQMDMVS